MRFALTLLCLAGNVLMAGDDRPVGADQPRASFWSATERRFNHPTRWLKLGLEIRGRSDNYHGLNGLPGLSDSYYLHRLRLNAEVIATPWMRFVMQAQDSRVSGYDRRPVPYTVAQSFDLRQGFVELGRSGQDGLWSVRVGRQPLIFGDTRLLSTSNWGNVGPMFDAARISLRTARVRVDGFASLVVLPCAGFDRPRQDKKLFGVYTSADLARKKVVLDGYMFQLRTPSADLYTFGTRSTGALGRNLDYNAELAWQRGRYLGTPVAATASHWELGRKFPHLPGKPRAAVYYDFASGDTNPHDDRYQSFDSLYPTSVYGTAADFGWRNRHEAVAYGEWQATSKTKVRAAFHEFWLATRQDALYTFSGATFALDRSATDARVGSEFDVRWIRQVGRNLQLWTGYAYLLPGPYLRQAGKGSIHYPYIMWTFNF